MTKPNEQGDFLQTAELRIERLQTLALLGPESVIEPSDETGMDYWVVHTGMPDKTPLLRLQFKDEQPDARFVSQMIDAMAFAYHSGVEDGENDIKSATSFALRTLLGNGDWFVLREAAAESEADTKRKARSSDV